MGDVTTKKCGMISIWWGHISYYVRSLVGYLSPIGRYVVCVEICERDINNATSGAKYFTFSGVYNIISMYTMCL